MNNTGGNWAMHVDGKPYRSLWLDRDGRTVRIIDQRWLPHELWVVGLTTLDEAIDAIRAGRVRGGPLTGAVCAYGVAFAMNEDPSTTSLRRACAALAHAAAASAEAGWVLREMSRALLFRKPWERREEAFARAQALCEADVAAHRQVGQHGLEILRDLASQKKDHRLNVLIPGSAGLLCAIDWGAVLAPVYGGRAAGLSLHVWLSAVPRDWAGVALTRWELAGQGVPHTTITAASSSDMLHAGQIDVVLLSAHSVTPKGDIRNVQPLSALARSASEAHVPCYAAVTSPAIGGSMGREFCTDLPELGEIAPDITVSEHLDGLITERGVCRAAADALSALFPDLLEAA
jgi:methylthioribose-1-phosphate isomerase